MNVQPSRHIDRVLEVIDGALPAIGDEMRWSPDPLSVSLGTAPVLSAPDGAALEALFEPGAWDALIAWLRDVAADAVDLIRRAIEALRDFAAEALLGLAKVFDELTGGDQEVTRHGHAAMCPRHGPTKGGLCRKCVR
jgi:hypothetical protein